MSVGLRSFASMLARVALVLASVLLTLAVFEVGVRMRLVPESAHVDSDGWWKENWFRKRRGGNPREFVKLDPDLGWIPAANLDEIEYQGVRISTNAAHMRGRSEVPLARTDAARIAVVGDSYTFGQCAGDDETYSAALERALPDTEVLNLGVMGYGQDQALLRLRRDGFPYRPDYVVFGFHRSNPRRNALGFRDYGKPRFRLEPTGLVLENVPIPEPAVYDAQLWPPRLWNHVLMWRDGRRSDTPEFRRYLRDLSRAIVHQMAEETEAAGARLLVVYVPSARDVRAERPFGWNFMVDLCAADGEAKFLCVDPVPRFRALLPTDDDVREHFRCHLSPTLYGAMGEAIAETLRAIDPERFE